MRKLNQNLRAIEKRLMEELLAGKNSAIQLQTLLRNSVKDEGSISSEELAMKILTSFTNGISIASSSTAVLSAHLSAVDCGGGGSTSSGEATKKVVKDKRGCYKRKRTSDSWIKVSPTVEDGCAWRKYGQKHILHSKYPRCYYRCTHTSQGCKAKKQVQKMEEDPLYQITYFSHHTCTDTQMMLPQHIIEPDPIEFNLLSFQGSNYYHSPKPANVSSLKQEFEAVDTQIVGFPHTKSSVNKSSWHGIIGSGSSECKQVFSPTIPVSGDDLEEEASGLYSCASMNSFHGLDMEVDQLGDIDFEQCLLVEEIDLGEAKCRQVLTPDQSTNHRVVQITNVKPGKLRNVMSEGLVLCASNQDHSIVEPLIAPKIGECVTFSGHDGRPEDILNPKKKQLYKITPHLFTNDKGVATFKNIPSMASAESCTSSIPNATVV